MLILMLKIKCIKENKGLRNTQERSEGYLITAKTQEINLHVHLGISVWIH